MGRRSGRVDGAMLLGGMFAMVAWVGYAGVAEARVSDDRDATDEEDEVAASVSLLWAMFG